VSWYGSLKIEILIWRKFIEKKADFVKTIFSIYGDDVFCGPGQTDQTLSREVTEPVSKLAINASAGIAHSKEAAGATSLGQIYELIYQ